MTDTTAQIAAKGCTSTGITEDLAQKLHAQLGRKVVAVVELVSEARSEKRDGKEKVVLSILTVEPAPTPQTEEHLRELARAFHYERRLAEDGPQLLAPGDGPEPTVSDVLQHGRGVLTTDDDGEPRLFTDDEPIEPPSNDDFNADAPHVYDPQTPDAAEDDGYGRSCTICGRFEDEDGNGHVLDAPTDPENPDEPALDVSGSDEQDALDDERAQPDEPWEYDAPEGTDSADAQPQRDPMNPFAIPTT